MYNIGLGVSNNFILGVVEWKIATTAHEEWDTL